MTEFDAITYLKTLLPQNKLFAEKEFEITTAPSMAEMADMVYQSRDVANHFVIIDTATSSTAQGSGGGYFVTHQYTCVLLMRFEPGDEDDRLAKRNTCRTLKEQIHSKMLKDAYEFEEQDLQYFDVAHVVSQEMSDFMLNGLTGIWFIFPVVAPANLKYKATDWETVPADALHDVNDNVLTDTNDNYLTSD